jgi:DNA-binding NtrC family response regulator
MFLALMLPIAFQIHNVMNHLKIFIIDHSQANLDSYQQYLVGKGFSQVSVFNNHNQAAMYLEQRPHIVFLGNSLGYQLGLELLRDFKKVDPDTDVILLPGPGSAGHLDDMQQTDDYVLDYMITVLVKLSTIKKLLRKSA